MKDFYNVKGNKVHVTAIIHPCVKMGKGNIIGAYTVIGSNGEIRGYKPDQFNGTVEIGDNNVISEHVTIQRPAVWGQKTVIGNDNIITAHSHIGHDAKVGNKCEICYSILGGYSEVADGARIKMSCTIRNRKKVGENAVVGMGSVVVADVDAGTTVVGNPAKLFIKGKK